MESVERHVADNEVDRNHKRVRDIIHKAGRNGLTKSELSRRTQFLELRKRDEILIALIEAGQIRMSPRPSATKSAMVYRATDLGG